MKHYFAVISILLLSSITFSLHGKSATHNEDQSLYFCCKADNDLYRAYINGAGKATRFDTVTRALEETTTGSGLLILADGYPENQTDIPADLLKLATTKQLRLYIEYPSSLPGYKMQKPVQVRWERLVINSPIFGEALPSLSILDAHSCRYIPVETSGSLIAIGKVAGFDKAVYGLPANADPALFEIPDTGWLVATTGLSHFNRGRYAPSASWTSLWAGILQKLSPSQTRPQLLWEPVVHPSYSQADKLKADAYQDSLKRLSDWYLNTGIMPDLAGEQTARSILKDDIGTAPLSAISSGGDGNHGILEGFESAIQPDGSQNLLIPLRADCIAESAMALALSSSFTTNTATVNVAGNLLEYLYSTSGLCGGERANPHSPAYGLIAWGMGSQAWEKANYGDDNARALLATIATVSEIKTDNWNRSIIKAILANYRTTGNAGFRGDRIDMPELLKNGWRHYFDANTINNSTHFEAYLWACYIWAYNATGYEPLLEKARAGISAIMAAYPAGWRRNDMIERAHLILPLAWLVRVDSSEQPKQWLKQICDDFLSTQDESGAIPERENGGSGHYQAPKSNEEYGTAETPLIQQTGDKATDQLYTTGFALIGLHEAAAATGDPKLRQAEDKLADYLLRIQTRSRNPLYDGVWFRAFDYGRWDYWASSADLGWGAWVIETGWGQAWIGLTFALREKNTTLWDMSKELNLKKDFPSILQEMELPE